MLRNIIDQPFYLGHDFNFRPLMLMFHDGERGFIYVLSFFTADALLVIFCAG